MFPLESRVGTGIGRAFSRTLGDLGLSKGDLGALRVGDAVEEVKPFDKFNFSGIGGGVFTRDSGSCAITFSGNIEREGRSAIGEGRGRAEAGLGSPDRKVDERLKIPLNRSFVDPAVLGGLGTCAKGVSGVGDIGPGDRDLTRASCSPG